MALVILLKHINQLRKILSKKLPNVIDMSKTTISEAVEIIIESTWLKDARI